MGKQSDCICFVRLESLGGNWQTNGKTNEYKGRRQGFSWTSFNFFFQNKDSKLHGGQN
jgi:hypothetical protein